MWSFVDQRIIFSATKCGTPIDGADGGGRTVSFTKLDLRNFVNSLASDLDVSWVLKRGERFFEYGVIRSCRLNPDDDSLYDLWALQAVLVCLQVPESTYDWNACVQKICAELGGLGEAMLG